MAKITPMKGLRFGRILVLSYAGVDSGKRQEATWNCLCDCGTEVCVRGSSLRLGLTTSCGCYRQEVVKEINKTHGHSSDGILTTTYKSWLSMIKRCTQDLKYYSDKVIDTEWLLPNGQGFKNFLGDLGECPADNMTLDRIDPKGNYNKGNCRWADEFLQAQNKSIQANNTTGRTGVYFREERIANPWVVVIMARGERINVGSFSTFEAACAARQEAELEHFGFIKE